MPLKMNKNGLRTGTVNGYKIGPKADLRGAKLAGCNLIKADLSEANLTDANLSGANLQEAKLMGADLTSADLSHAGLEKADLFQANLFDTDLTSANLLLADFMSADLTSAKIGLDTFLQGADFTDATVDSRHVPLIEAAQREALASLRVSDGRAKNPRRSRSRDDVFFLDRNDNVWQTCAPSDLDAVNFGPRGAARKVPRSAYRSFVAVGYEDDWQIVELH